MARVVSYSPEALAYLEELEDFIAEASYPATAAKYIQRLTKACNSLGEAPFRGQSREDFRPGVRTTGFEGRVTILFEVREAEVLILGIYYGGKALPSEIS